SYKRLSYKVQNPGRKVGTSIVLHGVPGSGKNLLFAPLMAIFGQYAREVGQAQLDSPYTGWLSCALFLLCDEVEINATRTQNKLKSLITSPRVAIEEKYQPVRFEDNYADLHFLSNGVAPIAIEAGDRRYFVMRLDEVSDPAYYRDLAAVDPGAVRELLMATDLSGWNPAAPPPMTARKEELFALTKPSAERFLDEWRAGELPVPAGAALASDLYTAYATWAKTRGEAKDMVSVRRFGCVAGAALEKTVVRLGDRTAKAYVEPDMHQAGDLVAHFVRALEAWIRTEQARRL
ncbi:MAG: primase-helicase family protein, partial [Rhodospirillaceae bacterium]